MLHTSTQKLILKLCELTDANVIAWKEGEGERPCSVFESEGYIIEVTAEPPTVRLLRADDGRELERADAVDLAGSPWAGGSGTFATHVAAMASRAHRVARGAEAAISKILSSLSASPQKILEPEPSPAAPEFDVPELVPAPAARAAESETAMAAVSADMDSLRKSAAAEPPQSHSAPEATPAEAPAPPRPVSTPELLASTAPAALAQAGPRTSSPPQFIPAPQPRPAPRPESAFGATLSFSRTPPPTRLPIPTVITPKLTPTKVTSGGLLFTGFSAATRQTVHGEPAPQPQKPAPVPPPEAPKRAAAGADIYKPWV